MIVMSCVDELKIVTRCNNNYDWGYYARKKYDRSKKSKINQKLPAAVVRTTCVAYYYTISMCTYMMSTRD